jgi:hypothetical protein
MCDCNVSLSSDQRALIENNGSVNTFQRTKEPWFKFCSVLFYSSRSVCRVGALRQTSIHNLKDMYRYIGMQVLMQDECWKNATG